MAFTGGLGGSGSGGFNIFTGTHMKSKPGRRVGAPKRSFKQQQIDTFKREWTWLIPALKFAKGGYKIAKVLRAPRKVSKKADQFLERANTRVFKSKYTNLSSKQKTAVKWAQINASGSLATWLANQGLRPIGIELRDFGIGPPVPRGYSRWQDRRRKNNRRY